MLQWVLLITAAYVTGVTLEQPNPCRDDSHCSSGYYCLTDTSRCHECLQCDALKREPPANTVKCIKSVVECGPCLKGLVTDRLAGGNGCTEPESSSAVPVWAWALVVGLVLLGLLLAALLYALRHTDSIKLTTRTSVQAPVVCNGNGAGGEAPSAPAPPPPYYPEYTAVRPAEPVMAPPANFYAEGDGDGSVPLVKRVGSERGGAARESAGSQNARVFSNPHYVRNVPPPSYDSALSDDSDHETPFVPHDEETMESVWTPATHNGDANGNSEGAEQETGAGAVVSVAGAGAMAGVGAGAGATRRGERADRGEPQSPPPAKIRCVEQDTNNNEGGGPSNTATQPTNSSHQQPPLHQPANAPSVIINVLNVNAVHHINDVSL